MNVAELLAEKRDAIMAVCSKHGAFDVRVFGSVARGDFDERSDKVNRIIEERQRKKGTASP